MITASLAQIDTAHTADAASNADFVRGLVYGLAFSVPLWGAIIASVRLLF